MSTYAEWAETHESDIIGDGYGSDHLWHYEGTPSNASGYKCALCFCHFAHFYNSVPDIFEAMRLVDVPAQCARTPMWPIRQEYASKQEIDAYKLLRSNATQLTGRGTGPND